MIVEDLIPLEDTKDKLGNHGPSIKVIMNIKVCGCYMVIFLDWTPIFNWCVVG
jgi:hypothetical protein